MGVSLKSHCVCAAALTPVRTIAWVAQVRAAAKKQAAGKYVGKVQAREARKQHVTENPLPRSELDDLFRADE